MTLFKPAVALAFIVSGVTGFSPASCVAADPAAALRVLTYNVHHGEGTDGVIDLDRIADVIRRSEADLVALQEVDVETRRSGGVDQLAELARKCDMQSCFGKNLDFQGGGYGNAILARGEILDSHNVPLPRLGGEQRGALIATVRLGDTFVAQFISTHFDHRVAEARRAAAEAVARLIRSAGEPTVIAGDLNAEADSEELAPLMRFVRRPRRSVATIPVTTPKRQIDFVLAYPRASWRFDKVCTIEAARASDHLPLLTVLRIAN
jgi:endonuclease/exonuclease/phosphatase family metal-dependent hydrolase